MIPCSFVLLKGLDASVYTAAYQAVKVNLCLCKILMDSDVFLVFLHEDQWTLNLTILARFPRIQSAE